MPGLVDQGPKEHKQTGHNNKYRQQCKQNGLDQAYGHIRADLELHKDHGKQTADGGQAAGADLRDGFGQGYDGRFPNGLCFVLFFKTVYKNNGIVQRKRQLQNTGNRVADKRDFFQHKVAACIAHHGDDKGHQQYGHFPVSLGGEQQYHHHNNCHIDHNDLYFGSNCILQRGAQVRGETGIVPLQGFLYKIQCGKAAIVLFSVREGNIKKSRGIDIVIPAVIIVYVLHAFKPGKNISQGLAFFFRDVAHHDPCGSISDELFVHDIQRLTGFGRIWQKSGQIIFHFHPVPGEKGEHEGDQRHQKEQIPFIHHKGGQFYPK